MFNRLTGELFCEAVPVAKLAETYGTPLYIYSQSAIENAYLEFKTAAANRPILYCFGMKANSNIAVLKVLADLGAGFDIVSGGELQRVLKAGGRAERIVFSGVGKSADEIRMALEVGILCFNVESEAELDRIQAVASALNRKAPISLRINPEVDAGTHPYISTGLKENKFGVEYGRALETYQYAASLSHLQVIGIDCHIGSQITETAPFLAALDKLLDLMDRLAEKGIRIEHLDLGGGLGIDYQGEIPPSRQAFIDQIFAALEPRVGHLLKAGKLHILFEFGRSLVGNAGVLLSRVEFLKRNGDKHFAIIDAAMNDLLRPTLYQAFHRVEEVLAADANDSSRCAQIYDVVGPVCESGDWLAKERSLRIAAGDLLAIHSAGAYGIGMSSNYNTRNRAAEILVKGDKARLIRRRETFEDQLRLESL